jgi:uncharacterized protein YrrD
MQRNSKSLIGYIMEATDGEIGKVDELYFDDRTWKINYLIVNTGSWLSGREVLISTAKLANTRSERGVLPVNLTKEQVRNSPDMDTNKPVSRQQEDENPDKDLHLRSIDEVMGYNIHATDGEIGHIKDFILDDETWQIEYLLVDTHNWFGGKKVLIETRHIQAVQWERSLVFADISMDAVKNSEAYQPLECINR